MYLPPYAILLSGLITYTSVFELKLFSYHREELVLVDDGNAEVAGFFELGGAHVVAGEDIVGFLRYGAAVASAVALYERFVLLAGVEGEYAADYECLPSEDVGELPWNSIFGNGHCEAGGAQTLHHAAVLRVGEEALDGEGYARTHILDGLKLRRRHGHERVDVAGGTGELARGGLPHERYGYGVDHTLEGHGTAGGDAVEHTLRALLLETVEAE